MVGLEHPTFRIRDGETTPSPPLPSLQTFHSELVENDENLFVEKKDISSKSSVKKSDNFERSNTKL